MDLLKDNAAHDGRGLVEDDDFRTLFVTHPTPMWVYDP